MVPRAPRSRSSARKETIYCLVVLVAAFTGLRAGELARLNVCDADVLTVSRLSDSAGVHGGPGSSVGRRFPEPDPERTQYSPISLRRIAIRRNPVYLKARTHVPHSRRTHCLL